MKCSLAGMKSGIVTWRESAFKIKIGMESNMKR